MSILPNRCSARKGCEGCQACVYGLGESLTIYKQCRNRIKVEDAMVPGGGREMAMMNLPVCLVPRRR
jgi:hypothetical protein